MTVTWVEDANTLAIRAAVYLADLVSAKPEAAIALPTGATPLGLYRQLVLARQAGGFDPHRAKFFNLDEFVGKSVADPQSYGGFLWRHLFEPLGIRADQVRLLHGAAADAQAECDDFEKTIAAAGGLDLAILGLGRNGHVAFNEPGSDWTAGTRCVALTEMTRTAQSTLYRDPAEVPLAGLTMGLPTIRQARAILLLVSGTGKSDAMRAVLRGRPDPLWPVTAILDHPNLTIIADRAVCPEDSVC